MDSDSPLDAQPSAKANDLHSRASWIRSAGWLAAATVLNGLVSVVVGLALVRSLGPRNLGIYSVATVLTTLAGAVVTFRLDIHLLTKLDRTSRDRDAYALVVRCAYLLYVPAAVGAIVVAVLVLQDSVRVIALLAILEIGLAPLAFSSVVLQALMRQREVFRCVSASRVLWAASVLALIVTGRASVVAVIAARLVSNVVGTVLMARAADMPLIGWIRGWGSLREHTQTLRAAFPLAAGGIAGEAYGRVDQPILSAIRGQREVGLYAAGVRIADMVGVLAPVIQSVVSPGLVDLYRRGKHASFDAALRDGLVLTLVPLGLVVALVVGQSSRITLLLLGAEFKSSAPIIAVLAVAEWTTFITAAYASALIAEGRRRRAMWANFAGLGVNLAGNLAFIPRFGGLAAAWSSLAGYGVAMTVMMSGTESLRRDVSANIALLARCAAGAVAGGMAVSLTRESVFVSAVVGIAIYVSVMMICLPNDVRRLVALVRTRLGFHPAS